MSDIGKAYVQIVPSADGISGSISKVLGGEASSAGTSAGSTIASIDQNPMGCRQVSFKQKTTCSCDKRNGVKNDFINQLKTNKSIDV